ncbi:MAG: MBL fold metallo-hydrolase [Victivallaceae bacterium]|nr:MBL fold metallo-hydrolase [Victivallaceae bacterium]
MLKIGALGSGSRGNSLVIESGDEALVIDVGFSRKEELARLQKVEVPASRVLGVLLTHEHEDHLKGCRVFCDTLGIPLCASGQTIGYLRDSGKLPGHVRSFEPGCGFTLGDFEVEPFAVQHDAINPVGFVVSAGGARVGVATDLGDINMVALSHLSGCDALVIESNYDETMLRNSDRQLYLKRRILGRHGHLDNLTALGLLDRLLGERTRLLLLAHLSSECNSPELVRSLYSTRLHEIARDDVTMGVIPQDTTLGPFEI